MDEDFSAGLGQGRAESGDVADVEKSRPGDVFYVGCKGEGTVQNDAEALDLGGKWNRETVYDDVWDGGDLGFGKCVFGADEQDLSFASI